MPNQHILGIDSGSTTPVTSRTPNLTPGPKGDEETSNALQEMMKATTKREKDFEVQLSEVLYETWARCYTIFFMLHSAEHEILNALKYKNIKKFSIFQAHISLECYFSCSQMLKCQQLLAF